LKARSGSHGSVEMIFQALNPGIVARLKTLANAANVVVEGNKATIQPKDAAKLFPEAMALASANPDLKVTGMRALEGKLDDVFRELTGGR